MTKEELTELLQENLEIEVEVNREWDSIDSTQLHIVIKFDSKIISESFCYM